MSTADLLVLLAAGASKIKDVIDVVEAAKAGTLTLEQALAKIGATETALDSASADADAAAAKAIDEKFPADQVPPTTEIK